MQLGMVGLGRMGAAMVQRLLRAGHECVVFDHNPETVSALEADGAVGAQDLADLVARMDKPCAIWIMVPAAAVENVIKALKREVTAGDILIDGGNSYYKDDIVRGAQLKSDGIHYLDVGTSGGVFGLERGYCLMIGGEPEPVERLTPVFSALAPGLGDIPRTPGNEGTARSAEQGYLHCGPCGAGHFVKMVHNGIEYGLMAAYAEGFNILRSANVGKQTTEVDAETTPLREPGAFQYDINVAEVAEVWRRGSVVSSWLLDLTAEALHGDPGLESFQGQVSDSGEGRWTSIAAIESGVPAPILSAALYQRFTSRGENDFSNKLLSAMRYEFGGHHEKKK
ncbi:6-phosphogluconate dehydrogenase, decarboxylating [hydrothermal vent metagenome]|uniref:6-phosphogluconate dehydrogenase, decarboxylating n=1 Tax=hydrothermal vent metagenome TaxID=652676 RepID=A0A3B1B449_9ZZZZ